MFLYLIVLVMRRQAMCLRCVVACNIIPEVNSVQEQAW